MRDVDCRDEDGDFHTQSDGSRPAWFWTGVAPTPAAPGMQADGTLTSLPLPNFKTASKQDVLDYFDNTWLITEVIFSGAHFDSVRARLRLAFMNDESLRNLRERSLASAPQRPAPSTFLFDAAVHDAGMHQSSRTRRPWPSIRPNATRARYELCTSSRCMLS